MGALADATDIASGGWHLRPDGLEHEDTGYFIERAALAARRADGHWEWPLHMAEKAWCAPRAFRDAFLAALAAFEVEPDTRLTETFALARGERDGRVAQPAQDRFVRLGEFCQGPKLARDRRQPERVRPVPVAAEPARRAAARA